MRPTNGESPVQLPGDLRLPNRFLHDDRHDVRLLRSSWRRHADGLPRDQCARPSALAVTKRRCALRSANSASKSQGSRPRLARLSGSVFVLRGSADAHLPLNDDQPQVIRQHLSYEFVPRIRRQLVSRALESGIRSQDSGPKKLPEAFRDSPFPMMTSRSLANAGDQVRVVSLSTEDTGTKITLLRSYTKPPTPARRSNLQLSSTFALQCLTC